MKIDKEWFCEQIHKQENSMYATAYQLLQNEEDVKDAMQDAILSMYCNLEQLQDKKKMKAWLMKILINKCYDILRRRKNEADIQEYENEISIQSENITGRMDLKDALGILKEPYKTIVILYYYQDLSIREISLILDLKQPAVKKRMQRAREQLKTILTEGEKNE